ncbi:hypothetical protein FD09_GL002911 [Schleiferilactobacillus perolens DSM 12744]|uniref:Uncharacterized protein n=2 Tax=Schleiferilactobacillus perolens TaxID=100468 RepID=A0A0R1MWT4_9LACO|nr:hypothetical protein FD09_GL002911 [Schleiferilactobacillus perolens DSM 12744]
MMALVQLENTDNHELQMIDQVTRVTYYLADDTDLPFIGHAMAELPGAAPKTYATLIVGTPWADHRFSGDWNVSTVNL